MLSWVVVHLGILVEFLLMLVLQLRNHKFLAHEGVLLPFSRMLIYWEVWNKFIWCWCIDALVSGGMNHLKKVMLWLMLPLSIYFIVFLPHTLLCLHFPWPPFGHLVHPHLTRLLRKHMFVVHPCVVLFLSMPLTWRKHGKYKLIWCPLSVAFALACLWVRTWVIPKK